MQTVLSRIWNLVAMSISYDDYYTIQNLVDCIKPFTISISTLNAGSLKLVDKFTYLGSGISSTENDISMWLTKAWSAIDRLLVIWKSDWSNKIKSCGCVLLWMYHLDTKCIKKKLDGNCWKILRAISNKSWKQYPTKQQLYCHLHPSQRPSKLDGQDMQDTAGGVRMNS